MDSPIEIYATANQINDEEKYSDDHGVYCLATGTSLMSNISSATHSQLVDGEVSECSIELSDDLISHLSPIDRTRLSLFELTTNNYHLANSTYSIAENSEILNQRFQSKQNSSQDMKKWILTNYNFNRTNNQRNDMRCISLSDESANSSNLIQLDSNSECII